MNTMLSRENSNFSEIELGALINGSVGHIHFEDYSHPRENSFQEDKIRDINNENEVLRHDRLV